MIDRIYKYVDIAGLEAILKKSTLKFTKPSDFNDPFEFHDSLVERDLSVNHMRDIIQKREPDITVSALNRHLENFIQNKNEFIEDINQKFQRRKDSTRVSCFSMTNNSLLMWSHYSNKHKGACIEFSFEELKKCFNTDFQIFEVNYPDTLESMNFSQYREEAISHWVSTKAKVWDYEKEIRFVLGSDPHEYQSFNIESISRIYFGSRMLVSEKEIMESLIFDELDYRWIQTSEMVVSRSDFKLENNNRR